MSLQTLSLSTTDLCQSGGDKGLWGSREELSYHRPWKGQLDAGTAHWPTPLSAPLIKSDKLKTTYRSRLQSLRQMLAKLSSSSSSPCPPLLCIWLNASKLKNRAETEWRVEERKSSTGRNPCFSVEKKKGAVIKRWGDEKWEKGQ